MVLLFLLACLYTVSYGLNHTNNWAVLVDTSRFWFNYRHSANVLSVYRTIKRLGIPDSRIILMIADVMACEAQNPFPAQMFSHDSHSENLFSTHTQVDYRGYDVTAESLMRVLTGRHGEEVPPSKRLMSDDSSHVLLYLTGHGGDGFFKFQDAGEIGAPDFRDALVAMKRKGRFGRMLMIADTCQANTLHEGNKVDGVLCVGSSGRGENSWSRGQCSALGTTLADRFTAETVATVDKRAWSYTFGDLLNSYSPHELNSHPGWTNNLGVPLSAVPVADFFSGKTQQQPMVMRRTK